MTRLTLIMLLSLFSAMASAQGWGGNTWRSAENRTITIQDLTADDNRGMEITLDEAVARVRRENKGRILSAKTIRKNGEIIHRIKQLTPQNQVIIHMIEAGSTR